MKVLIDPGIMPIETVLSLYRQASNDVWFISGEADQRKTYSRLAPDCTMDAYPPLFSDAPLETEAATPSVDTLSVWWNVINDHQTFMLYDRSIRRILSNSMKAGNILDYALRVQNYLERKRPDVMVLMATPHSIGIWLFARVAEEMGVKILYFQETLLPWRFALMEGLRRDAAVLHPARPSSDPAESALAADFERRKRGGFADAFPIYERDRLQKNKGRFYNFFRDARQYWKRPDLVINKALCYRTYQSLSQLPAKGERFVSFFMHFQPERTTLPESYGFGQQLAAVFALAEALPEGVMLYVKEHPSIYTSYCQWDERLPSWYRQLVRIPKVRLLPIETDPYSLIDSSLCVATVAGTIGGEALIRGKPVIALGRGALNLVRSPALHKYTDPASLRAFLADLETTTDTGFTLDQYRADVAAECFSGTQGETTFEAIEPRQKTEDVRFVAIAEAFRDLMTTATLTPDGVSLSGQGH